MLLCYGLSRLLDKVDSHCSILKGLGIQGYRQCALAEAVCASQSISMLGFAHACMGHLAYTNACPARVPAHVCLSASLLLSQPTCWNWSANALPSLSICRSHSNGQCDVDISILFLSTSVPLRIKKICSFRFRRPSLLARQYGRTATSICLTRHHATFSTTSANMLAAFPLSAHRSQHRLG